VSQLLQDAQLVRLLLLLLL